MNLTLSQFEILAGKMTDSVSRQGKIKVNNLNCTLSNFINAFPDLPNLLPSIQRAVSSSRNHTGATQVFALSTFLKKAIKGIANPSNGPDYSSLGLALPVLWFAQLENQPSRCGWPPFIEGLDFSDKGYVHFVCIERLLEYLRCIENRSLDT